MTGWHRKAETPPKEVPSTPLTSWAEMLTLGEDTTAHWPQGDRTGVHSATLSWDSRHGLLRVAVEVCPGLTPQVLGEVWMGGGLASQERLSSILAPPHHPGDWGHCCARSAFLGPSPALSGCVTSGK